MITGNDDGTPVRPTCLSNDFGARLGLVFALANLSLENNDESECSADVALALRALRGDFADFQSALQASEEQLARSIPGDIRADLARVARFITEALADLTHELTTLAPEIMDRPGWRLVSSKLQLAAMTVEDVAGAVAVEDDRERTNRRREEQRRLADQLGGSDPAPVPPDAVPDGGGEMPGGVLQCVTTLAGWAEEADRIISTYFPGKASGSRREAP